MSEQVEERKLESTDTFGSRSPELHHPLISRCEPKSGTRASRSGRSRRISRQRAWRPGSDRLRQRRLVQTGPSAKEILAACEMILNANIKSQQHSLPQETSTAAPSAEEILAACEMILNAKDKTQPQILPQENVTAAGFEATHESDSAINREIVCNAEDVDPRNQWEEIEEDFPQDEVTLQTNPAEKLCKPTFSVRVVLPRVPTLRLGKIARGLAEAWDWTRIHLVSRQPKKRLRVCETVSLGEKRFVSVIQVDGEQFLVGGAAGSVATLARLEPAQQFSEVLKQRWSPDPGKA